MTDEIKDRESALEQQYNELLNESKRKLQAHEVTIQRLTSTLADKDQQLQVRPQKTQIIVSYCYIILVGIKLHHTCFFFPFRSTLTW